MNQPGKRWPAFVVLIAAAMLWLAAWVFIEMAGDTPKGEFAAWDAPTIQFFRSKPGALQGSPAVVTLAQGITFLGGTFWLAAVSVGIVIWLARQRRWRAFSVLAAAIPLTQVCSSLLKLHFARVRPDIVTPLAEVSSASFPSGHAFMSAMIYVSLGVLLARRMTSPWSQAAIVAAAFFLSFLIGLSRIYLGVHYPTDVLAGWAAGTIGAIICSALLVFLERGRPAAA